MTCVVPLVTLGLVLTLTLPAFAGKKSSRPLAYEIVYSAGEGNEGFRLDTTRQFEIEFDLKGCFESFRERDEAPLEEGELLLQIVLGHHDDSIDYEYSIADRFDTSRPPVDERRMSARQELEIGINLFLRNDNTLIRYHRRRIVTSHRPLITEDARSVSREKMIREVARRARIWVCKLSAVKLETEIRKAQSGKGSR